MTTRRSTLLAAAGVIAAILACTPAPVRAAGAGSWTTLNDPGEGREFATVTLLQDGRVLIAGGEGYSGVLNLVELFDPTTDAYGTAAPLNVQREQHTATLLPNGMVLVAGGTSNNVQGAPLKSVELYNPATNTWTFTGNLHTARFGHEAALLPDGRVLVMGGTPNVTTVLRSCEVWDPATGTWSFAAPMAVGRRYSNAVTLPNGNVLEAGDGGGGEVYNVTTNRWTDTLPPPNPIFGMPLNLLKDGTVLAAPSYAPGTSGTYGTGQTYDPATNAWTATGGSVARTYAATATLKDGSVLIAGGCITQCSQQSVSSAVRYIPGKRLYINVPPMNQGRENAGAVTLKDGRVLMQGGFAFLGAAGAEIYTP